MSITTDPTSLPIMHRVKRITLNFVDHPPIAFDAEFADSWIDYTVTDHLVRIYQDQQEGITEYIYPLASITEMRVWKVRWSTRPAS